uniref:Zinc finger and SCAN domain-containing protein 2 n=1 Tax=Maylandia zebra TaxID=106582 RepID=A0A3P9DNS7_9CICH
MSIHQSSLLSILGSGVHEDLTIIPVTVKIEEEVEESTQSPDLLHTRSELSSRQLQARAGGEDRAGPEAARNLHPQPVRTSSDTGAPEDAPVQSGKPPSEDAVRDAGSNLKPFTCSVCNTSFSLRNTLVNHMRVHTGEKPFSCSVCAKKFTNKANVITHMAVHSEEKPFKCNVCDKRFTWHSQVKKHKCVAESSKTKSDGRQVEVTPSVFLSVFNLA